jgi:hypothetical protein
MALSTSTPGPSDQLPVPPVALGVGRRALRAELCGSRSSSSERRVGPAK